MRLAPDSKVWAVILDLSGELLPYTVAGSAAKAWSNAHAKMRAETNRRNYAV